MSSSLFPGSTPAKKTEVSAQRTSYFSMSPMTLRSSAQVSFFLSSVNPKPPGTRTHLRWASPSPLLHLYKCQAAQASSPIPWQSHSCHGLGCRVTVRVCFNCVCVCVWSEFQTGSHLTRILWPQAFSIVECFECVWGGGGFSLFIIMYTHTSGTASSSIALELAPAATFSITVGTVCKCFNVDKDNRILSHFISLHLPILLSRCHGLPVIIVEVLKSETDTYKYKMWTSIN